MTQREMSTRSVALRFVFYPFLLVGGGCFSFVLIWWMTQDPLTPGELLSAISNSRGRERWQAAYELARRVGADQALRSDRRLGRQALDVFSTIHSSDPEVAGFLVRVIATMAPEGSEAALSEALHTSNAALRIGVVLALAEVGDKESVAVVTPLFDDHDAGVRKAAAYAVGRLGGDGAERILVRLLQDPEVDVRWNAALGLANLGSDSGIEVLKELLDAQSLRGVSARMQTRGRRGMTVREMVHAKINGIRAAARLGSPELRDPLERLRDGDDSPRVQEAARLALVEIPAPRVREAKEN